MRERRPASSDEPVTEFESFDHYVSAGGVPSGRFVIPYEGIPVDFVYEPVENSKTTVIFFHGSTRRDVNLPMHAGARIMQGVPANRLAISDPSLLLDSSYNLILSWFAGSSQQPRLQHFMEMVIRRVHELTGVPNLIFMGSSGGGFASLEMGRRFPGSLVIALNPQIVLPQYYEPLVRQYLDRCWGEVESLDDLPVQVTYDLTKAYSETLNHTVAYIQNTRDAHHIENHQLPFFERVGASKRVLMLMDAWGSPSGKGHVAPPTEFMKNILEKVVETNGAWRRGLVDLGFNHHTTSSTVLRAVRNANANLPRQRVADRM